MNGDQITAGATSVASTKALFPALGSSRASPFPPATSTGAASLTSMEAAAFIPATQAYRPPVSQTQYPALSAAHSYDRAEATKPTPVGTPFSPGVTTILIRRLPINTSEEQLRLMMVWAEDLIEVKVLPAEQSEDAGFRSAILKFETPNGAQRAKAILDGKWNISRDAEMVVEILSGTPNSSRRFPGENATNDPASTASSNTSSGQPSRQPSRFNGTFKQIEKLSPPLCVYPGTELPNPETSNHYQNLFSPQSPIGNHLTDRPRISGKSLIKNDSADDDETGELLKDPVAYAENGANVAQLRPAAVPPQLPIPRMANLSLNTTSSSPSMPPYSHHGMTPISAHAHSMSPVMGNGPGMGYHMSHHYGRHNFPPVNPADQNPPCNTLYVGNLPIDTSEEELKAMFSKQRGYKRLCFRTKQNGPMCFVEFEDVSFATKALHELYGHPLHNSVKGGIRLSFSKNPLGVRSGQNTQNNPMSGIGGGLSGPGFSTANGPPPGLTAPPGLGMNRMYSAGPPGVASGAYHSNGFSSATHNGPWNNSVYSGSIVPGGATAMLSTALSQPYPAHMMGR